MPLSSSQIRWPQKFEPGRAPIHVRNELAIAAAAPVAWAWLIKAVRWPQWYANSHNVRVEGGGTDLGPGMEFRWRTFGVSLVSHVTEFEPGERIAWEARGLGVLAYHAWVIAPAPGGGCVVLTEETQYGFLARLGAIVMPRRMHRQHQVWLEALARQAASGIPA